MKYSKYFSKMLVRKGCFGKREARGFKLLEDERMSQSKNLSASVRNALILLARSISPSPSERSFLEKGVFLRND